MNKKIILSAVTIMAALIAEAQAIPWEIEEEFHPVIYPSLSIRKQRTKSIMTLAPTCH